MTEQGHLHIRSWRVLQAMQISLCQILLRFCPSNREDIARILAQDFSTESDAALNVALLYPAQAMQVGLHQVISQVKRDECTPVLFFSGRQRIEEIDSFLSCGDRKLNVFFFIPFGIFWQHCAKPLSKYNTNEWIACIILIRQLNRSLQLFNRFG